ncbi:hypothetical protein NE236_19145 [Actinoallomurus purpureus]|uniref:hypothetical protein n=1 Tax=Actinoallomurus purpureus TaxID=478114 RepID=UPI002093FDE3|nr:hypothetical protein [Actinoallomurus purpureus]MCO6007101.1 hypothetical protein [Actinoallomurus purpureus]
MAASVAARRHHRVITLPAVTGIAYTLSWVAGLSIGAPSPKLTASGSEIVSAFAGHQGVVAAQFLLTEGLPAAGLGIVSVLLTKAASRAGAVTAARVIGGAGIIAAVISLVQFALGLALSRTTAPGTAHLLFQAGDRLDGVKMLALAVVGVAAAASGVLPRWLRYAGAALAVAIAASGVVYLFLLQSLALLAAPALILLLIFVTGTGIALGRYGR